MEVILAINNIELLFEIILYFNAVNCILNKIWNCIETIFWKCTDNVLISFWWNDSFLLSEFIKKY